MSTYQELPNYQEFPKVKYHAEEQPRTVDNAEQEALLGSGWFDSPDLKDKNKPADASAEAIPAKAKADDSAAKPEPKWPAKK